MGMCKNCGARDGVLNGRVRGKQRYQGKGYGYNFVEGDGHRAPTLEVKRALAVLLYSLGKASFGFLGKLFGVSRTTAYNWVRREAEGLPDPAIAQDIQEIEFDEMWPFLHSKKTTGGLSRPWIVVHGAPLPGLLAVVMLQPSGGSTKRSDT